MDEPSQSKDSLELVDLGDVVQETRQVAPVPIVVDNLFGMGERPDR